MRGMVATALGPYREVLQLCEVPAPKLRPGGVRVQVAAAGVSFANILQIAGTHQHKMPPPFTPGTEVTGTVIEVASDVEGIRPGDRVLGGGGSGCYAEQVVLDARATFKLPPSGDFAGATSFATLYGTAWGALRWRARLQPGEVLLIAGAAGGTGLAAIDLGKLFGARVIAVVGGAGKAQAARDQGADAVINHTSEDVRERVLALTEGRGADVVFDPVGGEFTKAALRCIAPEGRLLVIGFAGGAIPQIPANILLVKNISAIGIYWGTYLGFGRVQPKDFTEVTRAFRDMMQFWGEGRLRPRIDSRFPLGRATDALDRLANRQAIGKVVLEVATSPA
jgi:NADPH:quinone reductase